MVRRASGNRPEKTDLAAFDQAGAEIMENSMEQEVSTSYIEYALAVILARALPDARDGLKPVHRHILWGGYDMGLRPDSAWFKGARVVGEVMGKYHPHGDSSIYDAMVRLAQPHALNHPLVLGKGNWGSPDDVAAAMRYTELKLTPEAMLLVGELGEKTVDFKPNYDNKETEPEVLPAAFPNLLVNGDSGIAVGMASKMAPHNLGEVIAATRWLLTHPNATLDKLMEFIPGPDLPSGGIILGLDGVRQAYETGRGTIRVRARATVEPVEGGRGRSQIVFTELPYGVGGGGLAEDIQEEILGRKKGTGAQAPRQASRLSGISRLNDDSDRDAGIRVVVECKVGVNPQALLADLYKYTKAEITFGINNNCLLGQVPQVLGLKRLIEVFIEHRIDVVRRRTTSRRDKRADRLHLVEGLLKALIDIDKVIAIIRNADDDTSARDALMKRFRLTEIQANYILNTRLRSLTKYNRLDLETESNRLIAEIAPLQAILDDETVLRKVISDELADIAKKYATDRKTTLVDGDLKEVLAASVPTGPREVTDDPCQVILSATGLIARTAAESEEATESRRRNGRTKHDAVTAIAHATARGQVLLVTSLGRAVKTDVLSLPVLTTRAGTVSLAGMMPAREIIDLAPGETVLALAPLGDKATGIGLALGTRQGVVKVTKPEWPVRSDDFTVIGLADGDEVIGATWLTSGTEELTFLTSDASLLHFAADKVRPQGLSGGGMAGINLTDGAEVVFFGGVTVDDPTHGEPVVITSTGGGIKVTPFGLYPTKGRATGGVRAMRFLKTRNNEDALTLAWVGTRPAAITTTGDPVDLPDLDNRRDGSGETLTGPDIIGHLVERD